jgi:hypothetical protein
MRRERDGTSIDSTTSKFFKIKTSQSGLDASIADDSAAMELACATWRGLLKNRRTGQWVTVNVHRFSSGKAIIGQKRASKRRIAL